MVFDCHMAPRNKNDFTAWMMEQTKWREGHSYDDPIVSTPALRAWFLEMIESFPAMNGPYRIVGYPKDESAVTDYSLGRNIIYAGFSWSKSELAYSTAIRLAAKHGLGFYDASSSSAEVLIPDGKGNMKRAFPE